MIHVVTTANQQLYARQIDQMFRMRHEFYVLGHRWSGLTGRDGKETDEFDDLDAVYLMSIDPWGEVAASVRLNPTLGPTLLQKFSHYSDEALPVADDVWDISRWIAQPKHRRGDKPRWANNHQRELMIGILEFCLQRGLTRLTMLAELRLAERIGTYGWPIRFLGEPREYEGGKGVAVAAEIGVGQHVLALTRHKTGILSTVLVNVNRDAAPVTERSDKAASPELRNIVGEIGADPVRRLVQAMADQLAGVAPSDVPQAIEIISAFDRLLGLAGAGLENSPTAQRQRQVMNWRDERHATEG